MSDPLLSSVHPLESQWALKASKSWLPSEGAVYMAESQVRTCPPKSFSVVQTLCFRTTTQVAKKKKDSPLQCVRFRIRKVNFSLFCVSCIALKLLKRNGFLLQDGLIWRQGLAPGPEDCCC